MAAKLVNTVASASGAESSPAPPPPTPEKDAFLQSSRDSVLIVEDNWLAALEAEAALLDAGFVVAGIAVNSAEAFSLCETAGPSLVLMDIRLQGGGDGIAAAIDIRSRFEIPVIFVSAHDDFETRARAEAARPLGWIVKPVSGQDLVDRIDRLRLKPQ